MGNDDDLIGTYVAYLRALGRGSLRSIESSLRAADRSPELSLGLECASQAELVTLFGRRGSNGQPWWSQATRGAYHARITGFFRWAVDGGYLDWNPMTGFDAPSVPRGIPHPVGEHELHTIIGGTTGWCLLAAVLAAWAGLRCCEIARLCGADITDQALLVHGKGGKTRLVPMHPTVWREVADLPAGSVMRSTGGRDDADWISRTARYRISRLGVTGGLHRLRHRFATRMLAAGASTRHVQEALGHASLTSTQVYTEVTLVELATWVAALPDVAHVELP